MQQRIDPDEEVAGEKHFDGVDPLAAPASPDAEARQIDMKALAYEVFFCDCFLAGFGADRVPEKPWFVVRGSSLVARGLSPRGSWFVVRGSWFVSKTVVRGSWIVDRS